MMKAEPSDHAKFATMNSATNAFLFGFALCVIQITAFIANGLQRVCCEDFPLVMSVECFPSVKL